MSLSNRRRLALASVGMAFPELSESARRRLCRRSYQHLGVVATELCAALARPLDVLLDRLNLEGLHYLRGVMDTHGSALIVTAHLGNWELLSAAHHLAGFPLTVVVRPLDSRWLNALAERLRRKMGVEVIDKREAARPVLRALNQGRIVGILLDQNASRREGVFVPFFGRLASTSRSASVLAVRRGTPIVPIFITRETDGRHRVTVRPPLWPPSTGAGDDAIGDLTARCTAEIEAAIREAPEQWLWVHNRWRTRPRENDTGRRR